MKTISNLFFAALLVTSIAPTLAQEEGQKDAQDTKCEYVSDKKIKKQGQTQEAEESSGKTTTDS